MRAWCASLLSLVWVVVGAGCGPSVWERSFELEPGATTGTATIGTPTAGTPAAGVTVREVPWGRVGPALAAENERIVQSETNRLDWAADQARESELGVLRALQLPVPAEQARLIGRSNITTTQALDPEGRELAEFAASVGADYAVWSSQPLGKTQVVEQEPVTRDRWRWERIWDADDGRFIYVRRWEPETVWVPLVIEKNEARWVVFYVKAEG
ncbi:MAG: hypothetical protein IT431_04440 [Phycisphaerales bacterium]|nr:hypothetical protein [Phycisphaerales bacterium]